MSEVLYAPSRERVVTTNAWAFLHWLRFERGVRPGGWAELQAWSAGAPAAFAEAIETFAGSGLSPVITSGPGRGRIEALADGLLFKDLRPGDRLLAVETGEAEPFARAADESASVLVAPAELLSTSAFPRPGRANLAGLRTIIATGSPMSPEARRRIYTWVKADVMLLAHTGNTYWGNPLDPVLARPPATPAFLTPRPSARLPR
ncbi:MAG TPA: hypothetical protein VL614_07090 [Acetobacteraceae bacterium]|jgi:hypothetical protein|nr:hypothetical protein [Acetobacteraceae bacterium]